MNTRSDLRHDQYLIFHCPVVMEMGNCYGNGMARSSGLNGKRCPSSQGTENLRSYKGAAQLVSKHQRIRTRPVLKKQNPNEELQSWPCNALFPIHSLRELKWLGIQPLAARLLQAFLCTRLVTLPWLLRQHWYSIWTGRPLAIFGFSIWHLQSTLLS